jgi:hypothetical protein
VFLRLIAVIRPLTADPLILRLHVPYLLGCTIFIRAALLKARRLSRGTGGLLVLLYILCLTLNLPLSLGADIHFREDPRRQPEGDG